MEHCVVFTVLPGRLAAAREFLAQLAAARRGDQQRSEQRVGIAGERWFLAASCDSDLLIGLIEADDLDAAVGLLAVSLEPYDLWFKRSFRDATGVNLNDAPSIQSAVLLASSRDRDLAAGSAPLLAPG